MGEGLVGKTLGQLGMGNIGAEVFRLAEPFGMRFIAHDPYQDPKVAAELGVELVGLEELFRRADFLSVSVPLSEATHHIVGDRLLGLMKPTAYLINTARGPVVDQQALHRGADRRHDRRRRARRVRGRAAARPTSRSSSSTMSSWRRTRCAGPTSASPATAPPTCGRCSR